jgi:hypothetical protein
MKPTVNNKLLRILSLVVFFLGASLGFALAVLLIWSRLEAVNYYFSGIKYEPFNGLQCPLLIAPTEEGTVTAVFDNPSDREDTFFYRAEISGDVFTRQVEDQIAVPPHQTRNVHLNVDRNDVDLRFFIFVKLNTLASATRPPQEALCGIVVANLLGLTGTQASTIALSLSFLTMAIGSGLWTRISTSADQSISRVMQILGALVLVSLLAGSLGWWLIGIAIAIITVLLMVIFLRFATA